MIIRINRMRIPAVLGLYPHEKNRIRDVFLTVHMRLDGTLAGKSDSIQDTVDYDEFRKRIIKFVKTRSFGLIEKLAADILKLIMKDKKILKVTIELEKPGALQFTDSVSVVLTATRDETGSVTKT